MNRFYQIASAPQPPSWLPVFSPEKFNREEVLSWFSEASQAALSLLSDERLNAFLMYQVEPGVEVVSFSDPYVEGCIALRIKNPEFSYDLLFAARSVDPDEVEFETWPPTSSGYKFFV